MKNYATTQSLESNSTSNGFSLWFNTTDINMSQCENIGAVDKIAGSVVNIALALFGSLGNVLVILVIWRTPNLRTICGILISNLAIADLLTTAFTNVPFTLGQAEHTPCEVSIAFRVAVVIMHISVGASLVTLTFLSIDRCFAICNPLRHRTFATFAKLKLVLLKIWIDSPVLPILLEIYPHSPYLWYVPACALLFCFAIILTCGVLTIFYVRKMSSRITDLHQNHDGGSSCGRMRHRNKQVAKTTALVIFLFVFSWTPFIVVRLLKRSVVLEYWFVTLALSSSAVNPFIYFYRHRNYRQALKTILRR